jgi:hypothetical protein
MHIFFFANPCDTQLFSESDLVQDPRLFHRSHALELADASRYSPQSLSFLHGQAGEILGTQATSLRACRRRCLDVYEMTIADSAWGCDWSSRMLHPPDSPAESDGR